MKLRSKHWFTQQTIAAEKRWRQEHRKQISDRIQTDIIIVTAPEVLSFTQNSVGTIAFFDELKKAIFTREVFKRKGKVRHKNMRLNLVDIKQISLPCAVVLSAELKRWTRVKKFIPQLRDFQKWDRRVKSLLIDLGTLKHLGIAENKYKNYRDTGFPGQVVLVELTSASVQDGEKIAKLQDDIGEIAKFFEPKTYIFRALLEATNNVIEHAYKDDFPLKYSDGGEKRWYATASYDPNKGALRFFVYDQGGGIPASLRSQNDWKGAITEFFQRASLAQHDSEMIAAAFEIGKTSTEKSERGKGLKDMLDVLSAAGSGHLRVVSGQGDYTAYADGTVEKGLHGSHIGGTLVEWSIPIHAITSENH